VVYALRKLIAAVFLGGMVWFVFHGCDNLDDPLFATSIGCLTIAFFFFWVFIPILVTRLRIRSRQRKNLERFEKWRDAVKGHGPRPFRNPDPRVELVSGENLYFREKGTLYVEKHAGFEGVTAHGRLGEVAFPGRPRSCRKAQRTRFYLTDCRLVFANKQLCLDIPLANLTDYVDTPGGIVFTVVHDGRTVRIAFTFQNPLITKSVMDFVTGGRGRGSAHAHT
jgi:hypothetical protein